jgi:DNA-binding NarL/FixJ family response regulator
VRAGLKILLESQAGIEVVGEAANRQGAFEIAKRESPDIFLVDIQLGQESALDFMPELLTLTNAKAILLTSAASEEQIHRAILAGATGLVYKDENLDVMIRAIRMVHSGEAWLSRSLMTDALSRLRKAPHLRKTNSDPEEAKIAALTVREREIVGLIARGMNRKKIAAKLCVSEVTVRNHLTSILGKLDLANQFDLVFFAQRHGLDLPSKWTEFTESH